MADTVEKVENRTAPKISRKLILRRLDRCNAPQRRYEGRRLFLCETMRFLKSPRAKRISGPKTFRPSAKKDFFNYRRKADIAREIGRVFLFSLSFSSTALTTVVL